MTHDKTVKYLDQLGVWFRYRTVGATETRGIFTNGVQANRWLRRFNTRKLSSKAARRVDYLHVQGVYEQPSVPSGITILRGYTDSDSRKPQRYIPEGKTLRSVREPIRHMAFYANKQDNDVLVFCPITGICGKLEMPSLPIALVYQHPLSSPKNALSVVGAVYEQAKTLGNKAYERVERQVWAGITISLLRAKHLLREAEGETTAAECNMVLQGAGTTALYHLCHMISRLWDNPNVWNKMPALNIDWNTHSKTGYGNVGILQSVQAYTRILSDTLEPLALSSEDTARYMTAKRERAAWLGHGRPPSYIKIHSASAVQARDIKDNRVKARKMLEGFAHMLPVVVRVHTAKVIKDLLILPQASKEDAAKRLEAAADTLPDLQAATALELADIIRQSKNERILDEIGSFMQEVSPKPIKTIAEILEAKRIRREESDNE